MSSNSESRKRLELAAGATERRREVVQQALERIIDGASFDDADALLDQLGDLGARVEVS